MTLLSMTSLVSCKSFFIFELRLSCSILVQERHCDSSTNNEDTGEVHHPKHKHVEKPSPIRVKYVVGEVLMQIIVEAHRMNNVNLLYLPDSIVNRRINALVLRN